MVKYLSKSK